MSPPQDAPRWNPSHNRGASTSLKPAQSQQPIEQVASNSPCNLLGSQRRKKSVSKSLTARDQTTMVSPMNQSCLDCRQSQITAIIRGMIFRIQSRESTDTTAIAPTERQRPAEIPQVSVNHIRESPDRGRSRPLHLRTHPVSHQRGSVAQPSGRRSAEAPPWWAFPQCCSWSNPRCRNTPTSQPAPANCCAHSCLKPFGSDLWTSRANFRTLQD